VKANTAGGERVRLSAAFTACANGEKLPVFAIIPRVNEISEITAIRNVVSIYKTQSLSRILFILDSATCHDNAIVRINEK